MIARKVMLLGEIGVGKSSLVRRLVFDKFDFDYKPTIGVDVYRYNVPDSPARPQMSLIIWDTDGNFGDAIFKHIYMKEASAALIIGDMSRGPTLDTMVKLGAGFAEAFPGRHIGYVVNKSDIVADPDAVPLPARLTSPGTSLIRTSAKTGSHVADAFADAADCIARRNP
jgi:tRNA U34 5-carboxymethylaminomethyl modifying GTPase MnmE/TrmE